MIEYNSTTTIAAFEVAKHHKFIEYSFHAVITHLCTLYFIDVPPYSMCANALR